MAGMSNVEENTLEVWWARGLRKKAALIGKEASRTRGGESLEKGAVGGRSRSKDRGSTRGRNFVRGNSEEDGLRV